MSSPLYKRIKTILEKDFSSFHTPGHKGQGVLGLSHDLTELEGIESLFENRGGINESETAFSRLYGHDTVLSAGGSTLCIQTMLAMTVPFGGKLIANRGVHLSVVNTMALLDLEPYWVYPKPSAVGELAPPVAPHQIEQAIKNCPVAEVVFITSPDYYGQNAEIEKIASICKKHRKKLIVDSAHGAHYKFLEKSLYPTDLGADLCCASLHKTLPAMTGAAILTMSKDYSPEAAKKAMSLFGSTSPSYAILLSADMLLPELESRGKESLKIVVNSVENTKSIMRRRGIDFLTGNSDPARLTFNFAKLGYSKSEFSKLLESGKIRPEYLDSCYCVLIPTINNTNRDWLRLNAFVETVSINESLEAKFSEYPAPASAISIRKAVFSQCQKIPIKQAAGRVAASILNPCPPGIPLVMPGERLDQPAIESLEKHGILEIYVL